MTNKIGVDIEADVEGLDRGLAQGAKQIDDFKKRAEEAGKSVSSTGKSSDAASVAVQALGNAARVAAGMLGGVLVGAALTMAVAFKDGIAETETLSKAIIQSGNAAGTTADQLQGMAQSIASSLGVTRASAAGALAGFVESGRVSAQSLEQVAAAAISMERYGGAAISKTIDQFGELAKSPVKASEKLNEQYNYLTAEVYRQITALDEQGRTADAAALAQETYATMLQTRSAELANNLGLLERAWNGVADAAKGAWDSMLSIGRPQALQDRIAELEQKAAPGRGIFAGRSAAEDRELAILKEQLAAQNAAAKAKGEAVAQDKAGIEWLSEGEKYLSRREKAEREIVRVRAQGAAAGVSEIEIEQRVAAVREKYAEKTKRSPAEKVSDYDRLVASIREKTAAQQLEAGVGRELTESEKLAAKTMVEIRDGKLKLTDAQKISVAAGLEELVVIDKLNSARKGEAEAMQHLAEVSKRFGRSNDAKSDSLLILPESVARLREELRKVDDAAADVRDRLAKMLGDGKLSPDAYAEKIGRLNELVDQQKSKVTELNDAQDRLNASWETGAERALQRYADSARDVARQTEQAFSRAFAGMEDALVSFVQTGKFDFSKLADSIIADLIRIQIRESMTQSLGAGSGGLGGLLMKGIGILAGSVGGAGSSTWGGSVQGNADYVYDLHTGGIAGQGGSAHKLRDMSMFDTAPRYHTGAIAGNEQPAVLLKGEGVFTEAQMKALAPVGSAQPSVTVNVINQSSQPVTAGQPKLSMDAMGQMVVEVMLTDLRRNGPYAQQLKRAG